MTKFGVPSVGDMIFAVAAPIEAIHGGVKLTQSDGDLAAHVRMGETILAARSIPAHSLASYTAATQTLVAHAWLSEVLFALLFRVGGIAMLAVFTAIIIGFTHAGVALFLRHKGVDARWALAVALGSLTLSLTHWLARPHMFSIAAAFITIVLLESEARRSRWFFGLFVLWANLHGGWLLGLVLIGAYAAGEGAEYLLTRDAVWKFRMRSCLVAGLWASLATLVNPYGLGLHREVIFAVTSKSLAGGISEYMAPNFQELAALPFLVGLIASILILALVPRRMRLPHLAVLLISLLAALQSFRNIALFGVTAWPLVALHAYEGWPRSRRHFPYFSEVARLDRQAGVGLWSLPVLAFLLLLGLGNGRLAGMTLIEPGFDGKKFPVAAVARAREDHLAGRVFHPWVWGGYLMEAWPGTRIHVDPLKFSEETMRSYTTIYELRPGWQSELRRWRVATVMIPPRSMLATALKSDSSWRELYRDSTAVIFRTIPRS